MVLHRFPFHLSGLQLGVGDEQVPDERLEGFGVGRNRRGVMRTYKEHTAR